MKKERLYTADFETTSCRQRKGESKEDYRERAKRSIPSVYSWGLMNEKGEFEYGIDIKSFFETIFTKNEDIKIYFHNGGKFDLKFVIPHLKEMGVKLIYRMSQDEFNDMGDNIPLKMYQIWLEKLFDFYEDNREKFEEEFDDEIEYLYILKDNFENKEMMVETFNLFNKRFLKPVLNWNPTAGECSMIADENFNIYDLTITSPQTKKSKKVVDGKTVTTEKYRTIKIWDSVKMFPNSISDFGKTLNNHHKTDIYSKETLSSDYTKEEVYANIEEFENDGNELEYLKKDCLILLKYLEMVAETFPMKHWKMTAGATAYNRWKYEFFGPKLVEELKSQGGLVEGTKKRGMKTFKIVEGIYTFDNDKHFEIKGTKTISSKQLKEQLIFMFFPNKIDDMLMPIYKWYKGGLTFVNPKWAGCLTGNVMSADINSSYPSVMLETIPYGYPIRGDGGKDYPYKLYTITTVTDLVNEKGLPFIGVANDSGRMPYVKTIPSGTTFFITSNELIRFERYYKGEIKKEVNYSFKTISGSYIFGDYIDFFYEMKTNAKKTGNGGETVISKLNLNSLYGYMARKRERISRIYDIDNKEWYKQNLTLTCEYYLPAGLAITAAARMKLIDFVGEDFEEVLGGDTDSIFFNQNKLENFKKNATFDPLKLGAWDIELANGKGIFRRAKQYYFKGLKGIGGKEIYKMAFAGLFYRGIEDTFTIKDFIFGKKIDGQKVPIKLNDGVFILDGEKDIKPMWDKGYFQSDAGQDKWFTDEDSFLKNWEKQSHLWNKKEG